MVTVLEDVFLALNEFLLFAWIPCRDGAKVADDAGIDFDVGLASRLGTGRDEGFAAFRAVAGGSHRASDNRSVSSITPTFPPK